MTDPRLPFIVCVCCLWLWHSERELWQTLSQQKGFEYHCTPNTHSLARTHRSLLLLLTFSSYPSFSWTVVCLCLSFVRLNADPLLVAPHPEESPLNGYGVERKDRRETLSLLARQMVLRKGQKHLSLHVFYKPLKSFPFPSVHVLFSIILPSFFHSILPCTLHLVNNSERSDLLFREPAHTYMPAMRLCALILFHPLHVRI